MARALVVYASKLGSTGEIAEALAVELRAAGHRADVQPVTAVRSLAGYEAVILGSALYAAHWQRDANRFVQRHLAALQAVPVWLFSSGPLDSRLALANLPITEHAQEVTGAIGSIGHRTFGGRLLADAPVDPQVLATHAIGDFRNWDDIQAWGREIAAALGPGDRGGAGVVTDREPLVVGTVIATPGTRATGVVAVGLGGGINVDVPVVLVHGSQSGPRVAATAGIHGAEYVSIAALREVALGLDPATVRGSLVAVLTANPAAFAARSIYVNPIDGMNLNRQFPGDPEGSPTQRLAHWLTTNVIAGSDAFVDMHCGDMNEALVSFTGIEDTGDAVVDARSRQLAEAYGLRYLLIGPSPGTTTTAAAALRIPAVLGEVGGEGRWPAEDVALHAAGFRRVLQAMGVVENAPTGPRHRTEILPTEAWMRATTTGYWHPAVGVGDRVARGTVVGEVQDAFGTVLERPEATIDGVVIFLVSSLAMNAGDPLLALAG